MQQPTGSTEGEYRETPTEQPTRRHLTMAPRPTPRDDDEDEYRERYLNRSADYAERTLPLLTCPTPEQRRRQAETIKTLIENHARFVTADGHPIEHALAWLSRCVLEVRLFGPPERTNDLLHPNHLLAASMERSDPATLAILAKLGRLLLPRLRLAIAYLSQAEGDPLV